VLQKKGPYKKGTTGSNYPRGFFGGHLQFLFLPTRGVYYTPWGFWGPLYFGRIARPSHQKMGEVNNQTKLRCMFREKKRVYLSKKGAKKGESFTTNGEHGAITQIGGFTTREQHTV